MHPNDVDLAGVYTRKAGSATSDVAFPSDTGFEVVVDAQAGTTKLNDAGEFNVGIVVRDLTDGLVIPATLTTPAPGAIPWHLHDATMWPNPVQSFVFTVKKDDLGAAKQNHICEAIAYLTAGATTPDVSFDRSDLFVIHAP
jgi:hypothetical protein